MTGGGEPLQGTNLVLGYGSGNATSTVIDGVSVCFSPGTVTALAMTRQNAPRPPNAWILYRSDRLKELPPLAQGERRAQADVSRMISRMWKNETDETRQHYERLADEKKAEHSIKYPGYRFQPMKKEERVALREQKKMVKDAERKSRQQQRGRASQQPPTLPPTSHSTPEPQALQVPPLYIQHSHLYPPIPSGSIYYPIELFGRLTSLNSTYFD